MSYTETLWATRAPTAPEPAAAIVARIGGATLAIWREAHQAIIVAMRQADPLADAPADRHGSRPAEKQAAHALAELAAELRGFADATAPDAWQARLDARAAAERAAAEATRAAEEAAEPARLLAQLKAEGCTVAVDDSGNITALRRDPVEHHRDALARHKVEIVRLLRAEAERVVAVVVA